MPLSLRSFPIRHATTILLLAACAAVAGEPPAAKPFDPAAWLRERHRGRLTTRTPQAGKPLQPLAARSLADWRKERRLYERALRELIGPWPKKRPPLDARVLERRQTP